MHSCLCNVAQFVHAAPNLKSKNVVITAEKLICTYKGVTFAPLIRVDKLERPKLQRAFCENRQYVVSILQTNFKPTTLWKVREWKPIG